MNFTLNDKNTDACLDLLKTSAGAYTVERSMITNDNRKKKVITNQDHTHCQRSPTRRIRKRERIFSAERKKKTLKISFFAKRQKEKKRNRLVERSQNKFVSTSKHSVGGECMALLKGVSYPMMSIDGCRFFMPFTKTFSV